MRCDEIERMVNRYIDHLLTIEELEEFLNHIGTCSSCYDELETYFIVHAAMHQLDSDNSEIGFDMQKLLRQDIKKQKTYIKTQKMWKWVTFAGYCLFAGCFAAFVIFYLYKAGIIKG